MIYFLKHADVGLIKIGTAKRFFKRYTSLTSRYGALSLLGLMNGSHKTEYAVHKKFHKLRVRGVLNGTEWFADEPEIHQFVSENCFASIPTSVEEHRRHCEVYGNHFADLLRFEMESRNKSLETVSRMMGYTQFAGEKFLKMNEDSYLTIDVVEAAMQAFGYTYWEVVNYGQHVQEYRNQMDQAA